MDRSDWFYHVNNEFEEFPVHHMSSLDDDQLEYMAKVTAMKIAETPKLPVYVPYKMSEDFKGFLIGTATTLAATLIAMVWAGFPVVFNSRMVPLNESGYVLGDTHVSACEPSFQSTISTDSVGQSDIADDSILYIDLDEDIESMFVNELINLSEGFSLPEPTVITCIAGVMGFPLMDYYATMGGVTQYRTFMNRYQCRVQD